MHDVLETEREDFLAEAAWPQAFKESVRKGLGDYVSDKLRVKKSFRLLHERFYRTTFPTYQDFVAAISNLVVIGAEKGADAALARLVEAFEAGT
ncbi:MAG: hypothetical protein ABIN58_00665, partial [candidate division WOR-3 bacterium]